MEGNQPPSPASSKMRCGRMNVIPYWDKRGELRGVVVLGHETLGGWLGEGLSSDISTLPDAWLWAWKTISPSPGLQRSTRKTFLADKGWCCAEVLQPLCPSPRGWQRPGCGFGDTPCFPQRCLSRQRAGPPPAWLPAPGPKPARSLPARHLPPAPRTRWHSPAEELSQRPALPPTLPCALSHPCQWLCAASGLLPCSDMAGCCRPGVQSVPLLCSK